MQKKNLFAHICIGLASMSSATMTLAETNTVFPTFLLMGEVHDNPEGHKARLNNLQTLIHQGWRPAIAMEQFDRENNTVLQQAMQACKDAQCVIDKAKGNSNWEWSLYAPVIETALTYHLPIVAANVSRADATLIRQQGFKGAFSEETIKQFSLPGSITPALRKGQEDAIIAGHCGYKPEEKLLTGFVNAQIARDIWMAKTMMDYKQTGVVLLAGNGHVRNDVGAVYWLHQQGQQQIKSIAYLEPTTSYQSAFDSVETISAHDRKDPCASFKAAKPQ